MLVRQNVLEKIDDIIKPAANQEIGLTVNDAPILKKFHTSILFVFELIGSRTCPPVF